MSVSELARRLSVVEQTVQRHVNAPDSGVHLYDGRVFAGTAREWGHYA